MAAKPSPIPFQPYRKAQAAADADIARILEAAARAIRKRVTTLKPGIGGEVRKAQLNATLAAIKRVQGAMWTGAVNPRIARGMVDAEKAAEIAVETMTRVAYASLPDAAAEALVRGLRLSAESGLKSDAARRKRELSERVYRQRALADGKIEDLIRQGLVSGLNARELASTVYQYVSPTAPGGASYVAMRLARTEINNAFHERQLEGAKRPGVSAVVWNLSGSHKVPDKCNVYANHGGNGQWKPDEVPDKPHPQCFCYLTYVTTPAADFQKQLAAGDFDDEIDRRTRENLARLGVSTGDIKPTGPKLSLVENKRSKPKTGNDAQAIVPKGLFKRGTLTPRQRKSVKVYETGWYAVINGWLRGNQKIQDKEDERTQRTVADIDEAMDGSVLSEDIQVWRGMFNAQRLFGDDFTEVDLTGFTWKDKGFGSTTTEESVTDLFMVKGSDSPRYKGKNVKMVVSVPKGTKALQVSTDKEGSKANGAQAELTLERNLTWRIVKDHGYNPETGYRLLEAIVTSV